MTPTPKKQRKQLTIVEKLQIIEMKEVKGYGFAKIAREKKLHEASVRTIYRNRDKIRSRPSLYQCQHQLLSSKKYKCKDWKT